jgi:hypothetical protein
VNTSIIVDNIIGVEGFQLHHRKDLVEIAL